MAIWIQLCVIIICLTVCTGNFCSQIVLHSCPKKLRQLLKKEELPPADRCPTLIVQFPKHSAVRKIFKFIFDVCTTQM